MLTHTPESPALAMDTVAPGWDELPVAMLRVQADGQVLAANAEACRLWKPLARAVLPRLAVSAELQAHLGGAHAFVCVAPMATDGPWVEWRGTPAGGGGPPHHLCACIPVDAWHAALRGTRERAATAEWLLDFCDQPVMYAEWPGARCRYLNTRFAQWLGEPPAALVGRLLEDCFGRHPGVVAALERVGAGHATWVTWSGDDSQAATPPQLAVAGARKRAGAGAAGPRELEFQPRRDADGRVVGCLVQLHAPMADFDDTVPVGAGRVAAASTPDDAQALRGFVQASGEGFVIERGGLIMEVNQTLAAWLGIASAALVGRRFADHVQGVAPSDGPAAGSATGDGPGGLQTHRDAWLVDVRGGRRPVELREQLFVRDGDAALRMTLVRDRTAELAAAAHIRDLAERDMLTGLSNRAQFRERLDEAIAEAARARGTLALLFIDLDHFKRVNDLLGHGAGDGLLRTVAARLVASLRSTDLVARFGGDEFTVLLTGRLTSGEVEEVGRKLLSVVEQPINDAGPVFQVTPSIGVSLYPQDGSTAAELIKNADTAMYAAKARGRAAVVFYDRDMGSVAGQVLWIESQLTQALAQGDLRMHLQPQVTAVDGVPVGAEALLRWRHPQRGWVPPDEFVPVAEQQRLIVPIGEWMIREAARQVRTWLNQGIAPERIGSIGVNLSTLHFERDDFVPFVARVLREEGIAGEHLELELTERMVFDDFERVAERLQALRALGVHIAVDDFGTGYSSLGQLSALPVDKVKIDRVFVKDLPGHAGSEAVLHAIVQMAHGLQIKVTVEGVETPAQRRFLADAGCDSLQGHAISPAMTVEAYREWLGRAPTRPLMAQPRLPFEAP